MSAARWRRPRRAERRRPLPRRAKRRPPRPDRTRGFLDEARAKFHAGEPGKPAVLLFHGLHRDIRCWTNPGDDEGVLCYTFREQLGKHSLGTQSYPGVGIYKVGTTDRKLEINANNFFDYLASRGFTVAAFSQGQPKMADAMPTAEAAYDAFLAETQQALSRRAAARLPARPQPRRAGHPPASQESRHRPARQMGDHAAHPARRKRRRATPAVVEQKIRETIAGALPQIGIVESDINKQVQDDIIAALKPLFVYLDNQLDAESRELAPDSDFMKSLTTGEKPTDGVAYFTFGGTNCNYMRLYYWTFTAGSSVPQYAVSLTSQKQYFKWEVVPHEIQQASPIYSDVAQKVLPEVTGGQGDGLVAIERSKLPWPATHKQNDLNHAECLFDRGIQREVAAILGDKGVLSDIAAAKAVALPATQSARKGIELSREAGAAATQRVAPPRDDQTAGEMADVNFGDAGAGTGAGTGAGAGAAQARHNGRSGSGRTGDHGEEAAPHHQERRRRRLDPAGGRTGSDRTGGDHRVEEANDAKRRPQERRLDAARRRQRLRPPAHRRRRPAR